MTRDKDNEIEKLQKKVKKLEAALRIVTSHSEKTESQIRRQFEIVAETMPVPMIISNDTGKILFANLNAQSTFGYASEAFTKVDVSSLNKTPGFEKQFMEMLSDRGKIEGIRIDLKTSDASVFPAVLYSQWITFDGQRAILTIVHDLTEVMALEKQLRHSQKMEAIGTLASGIAHDFNNILAAIFGYTELIKRGLDPEKNEKEASHLDKVQTAASRAKSMVMQMMAFCKQGEKERKAFHITSVVTEVVKMMTPLIPSGIGIRSDIRNEEMVVLGDSTHIHQVVTNLMTNALHALSGRGGRIDVSIKKADKLEKQRGEILLPKDPSVNYAELMVKDDGAGIEKKIIHAIFDPFFTTKAPGEGSGMGLAVIHGIIQSLNGALNVDTEPGKGVAFYCYVPLTTERSVHPGMTERSSEEGGGGDQEKILMVDDEPMILDVCNELFKNMGYHVTCYENAEKALTMFKAQPEEFDLFITDNTMPEMSGRELCVEIRNIRQDIPIVLISGNLLINESELKEAGVQAFIQKPFDLEKIQTTIRELLDDRRCNSSQQLRR